MSKYIELANSLYNLVVSKNTITVDDIRSHCLVGTNDQLRQEQQRVLLQCNDAEFSAYTSLMKFSQFLAKYNPQKLHKVKFRVNLDVDCRLHNSKKTCPISAFTGIEANGSEYHMDNVYYSILSESEQLELVSKFSKSA